MTSMVVAWSATANPAPHAITLLGTATTRSTPRALSSRKSAGTTPVSRLARPRRSVQLEKVETYWGVMLRNVLYGLFCFSDPSSALTPLVMYLVSVQHSWLIYDLPLSLALHPRCLTIPAHCPSQPASQPCCTLWHLHSLALSRPVQPSDSSSLLSQFVLSVLPIVLTLPWQSRTLPRQSQTLPRQSLTLPWQSRMAVSATLWHSLSHIVAPSQTIKGQSLPPVFPQFLAGFNLSHLQLNPSIPL